MSMMNAQQQQQSHDQHHMMGIMAHHGGMATMQPIQQHHPQQQQQQQQQQHFSPQGGPGNLRCCAGCGAKIMDRFLLHALDRYWHNGCLKCTCCQATLADIGSSCFTKAGMILCRADYVKMFAPTGGACSACGQMIPASELVMRVHGNVYHVKCFTCVKCHTQLHPGDRFNLLNGSVLCEQDCIKMLKGTVAPAGVRKTKMRVNSAIKV